MDKTTKQDALPDPKTYPYFWSKDSQTSLEDFLKKIKPSMVQDDGTKPWIWVRGSDSPVKEDAHVAEAIEEAIALLKEVTQKIEKIKTDDSIPIRSSKKTGAKSKKEVREQIQADTTEKLKEISQRHSYTSGKWLIFAQADKVDRIWSNLATSLVSGPLSSTSAYLAKVATCPQSETPNHQHVMNLYMPDVYDQNAVTEVMKVLLRNHGMNLTGVKSDLYTSIGLDSKHASGIQSTVWKNTALLKDTEIKELKDAFFSELGSTSGTAGKKTEKADEDKGEGDAKKASKTKPKLKKKVGKDDPFASDEDEPVSDEEEMPKARGSKKTVQGSKKKALADSDSDSDGGKKSKAKGKAREKKPTKRDRGEDGDQDSDDERTKKRKVATR